MERKSRIKPYTQWSGGPANLPDFEAVQRVCMVAWPFPSVIAAIIAEYAVFGTEERVGVLVGKYYPGALIANVSDVEIRWSLWCVNELYVSFVSIPTLDSTRTILARDGTIMMKEELIRAIYAQEWPIDPGKKCTDGYLKRDRKMTSSEVIAIDEWLATADPKLMRLWR